MCPAGSGLLCPKPITFLQEVLSIPAQEVSLPPALPNPLLPPPPPPPHQQSQSLATDSVWTVRSADSAFTGSLTRRSGCRPGFVLSASAEPGWPCSPTGHCASGKGSTRRYLVLVSGCVLPKADTPASAAPPPAPGQREVAAGCSAHTPCLGLASPGAGEQVHDAGNRNWGACSLRVLASVEDVMVAWKSLWHPGVPSQACPT